MNAQTSRPSGHSGKDLQEEISALLQGRLPDAWTSPIFEDAAAPGFADAPEVPPYRFFRLTEISEGKAAAYRQAMANVLSCLCTPGSAVLYLLSGNVEGIQLYLGVAWEAEDKKNADILEAAFKGNFLGAELEPVYDGDETLEALLTNRPEHLGWIAGVPSLNEDNRQTEDDFQGVERLVNSLLDVKKKEEWQLLIVAEAQDDERTRALLEQVYALSTQLSTHVKHSIQQSENTGWSETRTTGTSTSKTTGTSVTQTRGKDESANESKTNGENDDYSSSSTSEGKSRGKNESRADGTSDTDTQGSSDSDAVGKSGGDSVALTRESLDKRWEELQKHLGETLLDRFSLGRSKGMFRAAIFVSAPHQALYTRLSRGVCAIFQGERSVFSPLRAHKLPEPVALRDLFSIRAFAPFSSSHATEAAQALIHSQPLASGKKNTLAATWLNVNELALVAGLPCRELPGLIVRKSVDFALNLPREVPPVEAAERLPLGRMIQHGRLLSQTVYLPRKDLNKHVFITGVTGAGKTTTCMKLLLESGLPFLVIEPAKTEYRALHGLRDERADERGEAWKVEYYTLGREDLTPFRLNPFELLPGENLVGHIDTLSATLTAVFPMEAAMPYIVQEGIVNAYQRKGWDVYSGENYLTGDPYAPGSRAWPTFSDMIRELDKVIEEKGMGREFEEKYRGSLVARLTNLTLGTKGRMLNTRVSLDFSALLDKRVVIELEELKDEQDKALLMGLILTRLAECVKQRHRDDSNFQHLTLVEEAHRLLSRPDPGEGSNAQKKGVEMFANLLAEVRKYGEGLIIADQIPNKLVSDVIKNTHTKIVHRLFAADDRSSVGDAMSLSDEQKDFLPLLQTGETVIYCGGWHAPARVQITQEAKTSGKEIDEAEIEASGRRQLWAQRERLLPTLSRRPALDTPEKLAFAFAEIPKILDLLFGVCQKHTQKEDEERRQHQGAFLIDKLRKCAEALGVEADALGLLVADALRDCFASEDLSARDHAAFCQTLPKLTAALFRSLAEFDRIAKSDAECGETRDDLRRLETTRHSKKERESFYN